MKILYICHRFPFPPKRGGKIRPFNMIQHLHKSHQVTVASLVRSSEEAYEGKGLTEYCEKYYMEQLSNAVANMRMIMRLPTSTPSSMGYFYSPKFKAYINEELANNRYDLIFVHCSSVAQYVEAVKGIPKILDFGDMDSQKWLEYSKFRKFPLSVGYWIEGSKMELSEKRLAGKFDYCSCTTRAEKETLDSYGVADNTYWFPNTYSAIAKAFQKQNLDVNPKIALGAAFSSATGYRNVLASNHTTLHSSDGGGSGGCGV